jgi:hypothetical protein
MDVLRHDFNVAEILQLQNVGIGVAPGQEGGKARVPAGFEALVIERQSFVLDIFYE